MNKLFVSIIAIFALLLSAFPVVAQEVTPVEDSSVTEDNDVVVSDNNTVIIVCTIVGTQSQVSGQTQEIPVPEAEAATESDPAVQEVVQEQNLDQKCADVTIISRSEVNPTPTTVTVTTTPTATATPTPVVVTNTNTVQRVVEKVVEREVNVPAAAPETGMAS